MGYSVGKLGNIPQTVFGDFTPPANSVCNCACSDLLNGCQANVAGASNGDHSCMDQPLFTISGDCATNTPGAAIDELQIGFQKAQNGGSCGAAKATVAPAVDGTLFKSTYSICVPDQPSMCMTPKFDGTCVPASSQLCVATEGDTACPAGYPKKTTVYASNGLDDTRACDNPDLGCNCQKPAQYDCAGATLNLFTDDACAQGKQSTGAVAGYCQSKVPSDMYKSANVTTTGIVCTPGNVSYGLSGGTVAPKGAQGTICCK